MGFLDLFKKKNKVEESQNLAPNLMAADPAAGDQIDLMAPDPINTIPASPQVVQEIKINEEPGIEAALMESLATSVAQIEKADTSEMTAAPLPSAFDISLPHPTANPTQDDKLVDEVSEKVSLESAITIGSEQVMVNNKICPQCNTPNDFLNKFCVSCGEEI